MDVARWLLSAALGASLAWGAARASADVLPCPVDDALSEAAAALVAGSAAPTAAAVTRAARDAGSDATAIHALRVSLGDARSTARIARWLADLRTRADAPLACGSAEGSGGQLVLATARGGALDDVASDEMRARLAPGFDAPQIVLMDAAGELVRLDASAAELSAGFSVPSELARPVVVQLVARGPAGPRPVAERVVALSSPTAAPASAPEDRADASRRVDLVLAERLEELRERHGASPVRPNALLARAAASHARAVCDQGRVVHSLRPGADPEARLAQAGIRARVVGEAVARSRTPLDALSAIVRSPSHRWTLVDPRFTDAGIGVARARDSHTCLVVLLAAWPRVGPRAVSRQP